MSIGEGDEDGDWGGGEDVVRGKRFIDVGMCPPRLNVVR